MSQEKLGEAIGLTFQQVQKYERGSNRISAGTLYRLGQVLDVPVSFFFDCYDDPDGGRQKANADDSTTVASSQISRREARLLRLWRAAPTHVSDELLSLLSSLSPDVRETPDGTDPSGEGTSTESTADPAAGPTPAKTAAATDAPARPVVRQSRSDSPRVKPMKDSAGGAKPRRRHGAVWDPTDIVRATKSSPRDG